MLCNECIKENIKHTTAHRNMIHKCSDFTRFVYEGGDSKVRGDIIDNITQCKLLIGRYEDEKLKVFSNIEKDINILEEMTVSKIKESFEIVKTRLKEEFNNLNKTFIKNLEESMKAFQETSNQMESLNFDENQAFFTTLSTEASDLASFTHLTKEYLKKCNYLDQIMKEDILYNHFSSVIKNIAKFESFISYYDDLEKYPDNLVRKEIEKVIHQTCENIVSSVTERNSFVLSTMKLPLIPSKNLEDIATVDYSLVERTSKQSLSISSVQELKMCDRHKLNDFSDFKILLQQYASELSKAKELIMKRYLL